MLVDDNICNSIAVQFMFQRYDADADIATNGQEALEIIRGRLDENQAIYSLIVMKYEL